MDNIFIFYFDLERNQDIKYQLKDFDHFQNNDFLKQFNYLKKEDFKFPEDITKDLQNKYTGDKIKKKYNLTDIKEYNNLIKNHTCVSLSFRELFDLIPEDYKKNNPENFIYYRKNLKNVYCVQQLKDSLTKEESAAVFTCVINDLIKLNKIDLKINKIYYICHDKHIGEQVKLKFFNKKKVMDFTEFISPNLKKIINSDLLNIIAFKHESKNEINSDIILRMAKITIGEITKIIDEIDTKKKIIELIQKIISIWHPLAIDIQGLSEVESNTKLEYLKDIYNQRNPNYHMQLLVDFWFLMVGNKQGIPGVTKQIKSSTHLIEILSDFKVKKINFKDFFTREGKENGVDIGLDSTLSPNEDSLLVKFIKHLDNHYDPNIMKIPSELSKMFGNKKDFDFPLWLSELDNQLNNIANAVQTNNT